MATNSRIRSLDQKPKVLRSIHSYSVTGDRYEILVTDNEVEELVLVAYRGGEHRQGFRVPTDVLLRLCDMLRSEEG